jgi:peptide-methionine (S)-S-oxide reductase
MRALFAVALTMTFGCHTTPTSPTQEAETPPMLQSGTMTQAAVGHVGVDPGHATNRGTALTPTGNDKLAAFAAGCFWGVEDAFRHVPGVVATAAGYSGGHLANPTYEDVSSHTTGHAETVLVEFDPAKVSYEKLLVAFFAIHDPTQGNRQGPDVGDNYRSVIFTFDDAQTTTADIAKQKEKGILSRPVTTSIEPMHAFYKAEEFHQQYSERTGDHSCPIRARLETL